MEISNIILCHGEKMEDVMIMEKILRFLTSKSDYFTCSIEESKDIDAFSLNEFVTSRCVRTMEISNIILCHGEKMEDVMIMEKILRFLTSKSDYFTCSIEESKDIDAFSLNELWSSLLVYEQKMNRSSTSEEQALKAFTLIISQTLKEGAVEGEG
jgi:hypothetical protein